MGKVTRLVLGFLLSGFVFFDGYLFGYWYSWVLHDSGLDATDTFGLVYFIMVTTMVVLILSVLFAVKEIKETS